MAATAGLQNGRPDNNSRILTQTPLRGISNTGHQPIFARRKDAA
jgi:hypothetical protein